jgi:hypothetical protein
VKAVLEVAVTHQLVAEVLVVLLEAEAEEQDKVGVLHTAQLLHHFLGNEKDGRD